MDQIGPADKTLQPEATVNKLTALFSMMGQLLRKVAQYV